MMMPVGRNLVLGPNYPDSFPFHLSKFSINNYAVTSYSYEGSVQ